MKKLLFIFSLILILSSCAKKQTDSEDNSLQNQTTEKDFITMEEFLNEERNPNERCGITFYNSVTFCDIPDTFKIQNYHLFGIEGEYYLPKEPLKEIQFDYNYEEDYYYIQLPVETYEKNPELYLEAVQDEKSFFYNNKQTLKFNAENNYDGQLLDYNFYFTMTYRNLYSKNNKWTIYLKNVQTDEVITKKTVTINKTSDYVVYQDEYENPFVIKEDCNMQCEKKYNLMYKGKGSTNDNEGTIVVFSYKIDTEYVTYIPILAFKSKSDDNEVNIIKIYFSGSYTYFRHRPNTVLTVENMIKKIGFTNRFLAKHDVTFYYDAAFTNQFTDSNVSSSLSLFVKITNSNGPTGYDD